MDELYSLNLSAEEWSEIINLVWLEHNFKLADKIQKELIAKYPDIKIN